MRTAGMAHSRVLVCLLLLVTRPTAARGYVDDSWVGWTDRLGLKFTDDCQEHAGIVAIWAWVDSWLSGRQGKQRSAHCETKEMTCPTGTAVTGLAVKSGHMRRGGSRELFDFQLRCGLEGQLTGWMGLRFDMKASEYGAAVCPAGDELSGVQVMRGRGDGGKDTYNFKLRCGAAWRSVVGLAFESPRETRSATCKRESHVVGVRVHRGFQDWGDVDTYEFQLKCEADGQTEESRMQRSSLSASSISEMLSSLGSDEAWQLLSSLGLASGSALDTSNGFELAPQDREL